MSTELTSMNLPQRVAFANQLAGQINEALDRAWKTAVVLGWELTRLKAELPHGEFGKLFSEANCEHVHNFSFTQNMANRYMRLYTLCCEKAGQLGQAEALQALLGAIHPAQSYRALPTPGGEAAPSLPSAGRRLAGFLHTLAPEAHSMRQAMFTFMAEAGEEKKPAGAPLPHMRQQTARPAHTRHLAEMVVPGKPEVSRRDLTLAEWNTLLSTVETFIRDVARHLTNGDRDFCADQLRELATALQHAKGNLITTQE